MSLRINDLAPDFTAETTHGRSIFTNGLETTGPFSSLTRRTLRRYARQSWVLVAGLEREFAKRGAKVIGLSVDPVENHGRWAKDIEEVTGSAVNYPVIGDTELKVAKLYDMLPGDAGDSCEGRTPADNAPVRTVFVIGPDKKIKLTLAYPMTTGRNFDEIIRVLDSMQLTAKHKVATPANWKQGEDVIITGAVSNDDADKDLPRVQDGEAVPADDSSTEVDEGRGVGYSY